MDIKKLYTLLEDKFEKIDKRFDTIDQRFDSVDNRFDGIDNRLDNMDLRFDGMDHRFDRMDTRFNQMDLKFDGMDQRIGLAETGIESNTHGILALNIKFETMQTDFRDFASILVDTNHRVRNIEDDVVHMKNDIAINRLAIQKKI